MMKKQLAHIHVQQPLERILAFRGIRTSTCSSD